MTKFNLTFNERVDAAAASKRATLEKFHASMSTTRAVAGAAAGAGQTARKEKRFLAEQDRRARKKSAAQEFANAAKALQADAERLERQQAIAQASELEVQQKATRDKRYAARKMRK